jgi:hypothetical protein
MYRTCVAMAFTWLVATESHGLSCRSAEAWAATSANREYSLIHRASPTGDGATLRLVQGADGKGIWVVPVHPHVWSGVVSDDGEHIATTEGCGWIAVEIRDSAGGIARTIQGRELILIWQESICS